MKKILLGLSGGVDSSVAACILKEQGFEVTGCFLLLSEHASENSQEAENARKVAESIGIDFVIADYRQRFKENVSDFFINEYLNGRTPNPCIRCNPTVKFRSLADTAQKLGIDKIATGHYAKTVFSDYYNSAVISPSLSKKDQSYFLCRLTPELIEKIVFPLGSFMSKDEVRAYAEKMHLSNSRQSDSQEICFIPDNDYANYISRKTSAVSRPGNILDNDGKIIGKHTGIVNYTVGQRKGLGAFGEPRYVKQINAKDNTVTVCKKDERYSNFIKAVDISWAVPETPVGNFSGQVKIRSTAPAVPTDITCDGTSFEVNFHSPVLAPSPGQTAAVYKDGVLLGGGTITKALSTD